MGRVLIVVLVLVLLGGAGYAGWWYYLSARVQEVADAHISSWQKGGGQVTGPADYAISGFPFGIEHRVTGLTLTGQTSVYGLPETVLSLDPLSPAVLRIEMPKGAREAKPEAPDQPTLAAARIETEIDMRGEGTVFNLRGDRPDRVTVRFEQVTARDPQNPGAPQFDAPLVELAATTRAGTDPIYDIVLTGARGLTLTAVPPATPQDRVELQAASSRIEMIGAWIGNQTATPPQAQLLGIKLELTDGSTAAVGKPETLTRFASFRLDAHLGAEDVALVQRPAASVFPGLTFTFGLSGLDLPPVAAAPLGQVVQQVGLDVRLNGTLDLNQGMPGAVVAWRDAGGSINLKDLSFDYGPLEAEASGTLTLSQALKLDGTIDTQVIGYEEALAAAPIEPQARSMIATVAGLFGSTLPDGRKVLAQPLVFDDNEMRWGPVPLGSLDALMLQIMAERQRQMLERPVPPR